MKDRQFVIAEKLYKNVTDGTHDSPKPQIQGFPLVTSKNIKGGVLDISSANLISKIDYDNISKRSEVEKWDVIISMIGEYCGYTYIEKNDKINYAIKNVGLFKTGSELEARWLTYYLQSDLGQYYLKQVRSGSSQPYLSLGALRKLPIFNPTIEIKRKITSVLSALDNKIELNNKINAELEAMAKTIYDYWFVQFDFPDANGKPYKSSGGTMVWNETLKRDIPERWAAETINDLGSVIGGSTPSKAIPENFSNSGTPWITPKDLSMNIGNKFISKGETDVSEIGLKEASLNILNAGSVLMSSRAPIGYLAINRLPCTTNQGFKSVVCNKNYSCEYVFYVLKHNMPKIEANASGSTFKEISTGVFRSITVVKPSIEVVNNYVDKVKAIFQKQNNLEIQNQELGQLRDWLLPTLMNGQVTIGEAEEKVGMVAEGSVKYNIS